MSKRDISNKTLATLLIVAIVVSAIGTFIATSKLTQVTGLASSGVFTSDSCSPLWVCYSWSECSPEGIQSRECIDRRNCGVLTGKPPESRSEPCFQ